MARDGELPFETEPDVEQDADHGDDDGDRAAGDQLARDCRSHHLDAAIVDLVAKHLLYLGDGVLLLLLGGLGGDADQHGIRRAKFLNLNLAEIEPMHLGADIAEIGDALLGLYLDEGAALEVDAEIEADLPHEQQRHHSEQGRDDPGDGAQADEADLRVLGNEMNASEH